MKALVDIKKTRLLVADNSLQSPMGHSFNVACAFKEAAEECGINLYYACCYNCSESIERKVDALKVFRYDTNFHFIRALQKLPPLKLLHNVLDLMCFSLATYRDLGRFFRNTETRFDVVLIPQSDLRTLIAWLLLLFRSGRFGSTQFVFVIMLYPLLPPPHQNRHSLRLAVWNTSLKLLGFLSRKLNIMVGAETDVQASAVSKITRIKTFVLPIPRRWRRSKKRSDGSAGSSAKKHLVFLGDIRPDKGFDLLANTIEEYYKVEHNAGVRFTLQCCYRAGHKYMLDHVRRLERLDIPDLKLIKNPLEEDDYYDLLESADIVILPYLRSTYYGRGSGILVEAIGYGKILITTRDTWMARQVEKYGSGVSFNPNSPDSLLAAIRESINSFYHLTAKAKKGAESFQQWHNCSNFLNLIMAVTRHADPRVVCTDEGRPLP